MALPADRAAAASGVADVYVPVDNPSFLALVYEWDSTFDPAADAVPRLLPRSVSPCR